MQHKEVADAKGVSPHKVLEECKSDGLQLQKNQKNLTSTEAANLGAPASSGSCPATEQLCTPRTATLE
eukprot:6488986-Amphidinium_carterae.1